MTIKVRETKSNTVPVMTVRENLLEDKLSTAFANDLTNYLSEILKNYIFPALPNTATYPIQYESEVVNNLRRDF